MAKQAKKKQTDYTIGGRDISNTAIPLYQSNLTRMDEYLQDPSAKTDYYLDKYYTNTSSQNDFLRNYQRAMGQTTANNYASTHGGLASLNQRNYDDQQRYWNDYGARLYDTGVTSAYNMGNQDFQNMLNANTSYNQAYQLGKAYSDVDQYNDMVDQMNSNWWAPVLSTAGGAIATAFPGVGTVIGGAMQGVGNAFTIDGTNSIRGIGNLSTGAGQYQNVQAVNSMGDSMANLFGGVKNLYDTGKLNWLLPKSREVKVNG